MAKKHQPENIESPAAPAPVPAAEARTRKPREARQLSPERQKLREMEQQLAAVERIIPKLGDLNTHGLRHLAAEIQKRHDQLTGVFAEPTSAPAVIAACAPPTN